MPARRIRRRAAGAALRSPEPRPLETPWWPGEPVVRAGHRLHGPKLAPRGRSPLRASTLAVTSPFETRFAARQRQLLRDCTPPLPSTPLHTPTAKRFDLLSYRLLSERETLAVPALAGRRPRLLEGGSTLLRVSWIFPIDECWAQLHARCALSARRTRSARRRCEMATWQWVAHASDIRVKQPVR